jgi:hypothetical protein
MNKPNHKYLAPVTLAILSIFLSSCESTEEEPPFIPCGGKCIAPTPVPDNCFYTPQLNQTPLLFQEVWSKGGSQGAAKRKWIFWNESRSKIKIRFSKDELRPVEILSNDVVVIDPSPLEGLAAGDEIALISGDDRQHLGSVFWSERPQGLTRGARLQNISYRNIGGAAMRETEPGLAVVHPSSYQDYQAFTVKILSRDFSASGLRVQNRQSSDSIVSTGDIYGFRLLESKNDGRYVTLRLIADSFPRIGNPAARVLEVSDATGTVWIRRLIFNRNVIH